MERYVVTTAADNEYSGVLSRDIREQAIDLGHLDDTNQRRVVEFVENHTCEGERRSGSS